ncbi:MAG: sigma-70 family RNA polymerase sigma factor [Deltaproteobacteria bacterium]|nr:sigma-70 family RNA polymerase sigma factor [Deltaproteobacteria bacterium]
MMPVPRSDPAPKHSEPDRRTEAERADRLRAGDAQALADLAREQGPRVARLLLRLLGPRADREDLVQNVFLEVCRALPSFRGDSSPATFVAAIAIRVARRAMRPPAWWRRRGAMPDEPVAPAADGPEDAAWRHEQLRRLRRALERVGPRKRVAFALWAFEGLDVAEIAELSGASVAATRSRIFYAQKELRAAAADDPVLRELVEGEDHGPG